MNKKYGGLVSNPRNTKDTQVVKSITYTTNGTVVETVNLNAWPAATESDTHTPPEPTEIVSVTPTLPQTTALVTVVLNNEVGIDECLEHLKVYAGTSEQTLSLNKETESTFKVPYVLNGSISGNTITITTPYESGAPFTKVEWL